MRVDSKALMLRMPAELKARLAEAARENDSSLTAEIVARLATSLDRDSEAFQLGVVLIGVMNAAGEQAAERAGVDSWLTSPWPFAMAVQAAMKALDLMGPPGDPVPPDVRPSPEIVRQMGEEKAWLFEEATLQRLGANVANYLLGSGNGSLYQQKKELQAKLPARVADQMRQKKDMK